MNKYFYSGEEIRTIQGYEGKVTFFMDDMMYIDIYVSGEYITRRINPDGTDENGHKIIYSIDEWKEHVGKFSRYFDVFKPGDMLLVRSRNPHTLTNVWRLAQLSHIILTDNDVIFMLTNGSFRNSDDVLHLINNELLIGMQAE